jgi:hypothetical protein
LCWFHLLLLPVVDEAAAMKPMINRIVLGSSLLCLSVACNQAKFGGRAKSEKTQSPPSDVNPKYLDVSTPYDTIQAGGKQMQATAVVRGETKPSEVEWTLVSSTEDKGSIDPKGMYTSPGSTREKFPVTLVATLKSDPRVKGEKTITVEPIAIFVNCEESSKAYPILAKVYQMPTTVKRLPDYGNPAEATYRTKVCMENYAVESRDFEEGFPKVKDIYEYFSLQTSTTLIVPADGEYTFQLNSDDGSRLYIDGREVIDNDGEHQAFGPDPDDSMAVGLKETVVNLKKGEHPLVLNYFQGPRYRIALMLKWKVPGSSEYVYVPRESFK